MEGRKGNRREEANKEGMNKARERGRGAGGDKGKEDGRKELE